MWEHYSKNGARMNIPVDSLTGRRTEILYISAIIVLGIAGMYYYSKYKTVEQICKHTELSDEKVKAISDMMTKQHKK